MSDVIILGCNGMLGHALALTFVDSKAVEFEGIGRQKRWRWQHVMDLRSDQFWEYMQARKENNPPLAIVNCAGLLIGACEANGLDAIYINAHLPRRLAEMFLETDTRIIQISTDCVFRGGKLYNVDARHDGDSLYAKTKSLGELDNHKDMTIRTSIVGPELKCNGTGLFHWWSNQAKQVGKIDGWSNALWTGVTTIELAKRLDQLIVNRDWFSGVQHWSSEPISKFDLLSLWTKVFESNLKINRIQGAAVRSKVLLDSVLTDLPSHEQMAEEMRSWITRWAQYWKREARINIYDHYNHLIKV